MSRPFNLFLGLFQAVASSMQPLCGHRLWITKHWSFSAICLSPAPLTMNFCYCFSVTISIIYWWQWEVMLKQMFLWAGWTVLGWLVTIRWNRSRRSPEIWNFQLYCIYICFLFLYIFIFAWWLLLVLLCDLNIIINLGTLDFSSNKSKFLSRTIWVQDRKPHKVQLWQKDAFLTNRGRLFYRLYWTSFTRFCTDESVATSILLWIA